MKIMSIFVGKIVSFIGTLLHRGSSAPGKISLMIDRKILSKFEVPKTVIAVTGSSGKGSCSKMLATIYRNLGYIVAHNEKGSNLRYGITTLLLNNSTITGKIKADVLIYEVDERYAKYILKPLKTNYVIITNIVRDQPPRHGHFDLVFEEIKKAIDPSMHLILNADDPYLQKFSSENKYKITYYGMDKNKYSYKDNKYYSLNISYCPLCHSKLKYKYYNFETYGDYYCPNCAFKRIKPDYEITKLNYDKEILTINKKYDLSIKNDVLYNIYNLAAVFATALELSLDRDKVVKILNDIENNSNLYDKLSLGNRSVYILNNKNENCTSFNQSLEFANRDSKEKTIIIGWKEISRRYEYNDISWLYDIDFESLNIKEIDKVICVGINRYDIALRMKCSGIENNKIFVFSTLEQSKEEIIKSKGDIYAIVNFDYVQPIKDLLKEGKEI